MLQFGNQRMLLLTGIVVEIPGDEDELADKLRRNSVATANEVRQMIGWKPSADPKADTLDNPNLSQPAGEEPMPEEGYEEEAYQSAIEPERDTRALPVPPRGLPAPAPNRAQRRKKQFSARGPTG